MREYGQIQTSFWTDPEIQTLSEQSRTLAAYLLTGPHSNGLGCYRLPDGYIKTDLGYGIETLSKGYAELDLIGFAYRCTATNFVFLPKFLAWNPISNGKVAQARVKEFQQVPKKAVFYSGLCHSMVEYGKHFKAEFLNPIETLSKPYRNKTLPEQEQEQEQDPEPEPDPNQPNPSTRGKPPVTACKSEPKKTPVKAPTSDTWAAYKSAYRNRYGTEPVRNANVNSKLKQFVDRVGVEDAPSIAAYYLGLCTRWYVEKLHPVGLMLTDAESLHTQWATGTQVTSSQARQEERTSHNAHVVREVIAQEKLKHA